MDPMAAIRDTFFQECDEQLAALEAGLLTMEEGDTSSDTVNAVFRAVHSIKGGAGAFKLHELVSFAHVFETALDRVRSGTLNPDPDLLKLMLRAIDVLSDMVSASREGSALPPAWGLRSSKSSMRSWEAGTRKKALKTNLPTSTSSP